MTITNKTKKEEIFAAYTKQAIELNAAKEEINNARTINTAFETIAEYFVEDRYVYDVAERMEVSKNILSYAQGNVLNALCFALNLKLNDAQTKASAQGKKVRAAAKEVNSSYGQSNFERQCTWQENLNLTMLSIKECLEAAEEAHKTYLGREFKRVVPRVEETSSDERSNSALSRAAAIARAKAVGVDISDITTTNVDLNTDGVHTTDSDAIDQDNNAIPMETRTDSDPVLKKIAADGYNVKVA